MHFLLICNPENRRASAFISELEAMKAHTCDVIAYQDLLKNTVHIEKYIRPNTILKIDSPGENNWVRQALIEYGMAEPNTLKPHFLADFGRICYQDEWYNGFCRLLTDLKKRLARLNLHLMNNPDAILTMFDKVETKKKLIQNNLPTPLILENIYDYDTLRSQMQNQGIKRVFIKPAHSSSASGVVAFRTNGKQVQAITPIELKQEDGMFSMYNVLKVRTYTDETTVAALINQLLKSKICVEKWVPKASFNGSAFDFRVVVIDGKARHVVARTSKSPITNLHLGNTRGDLSAIIERIGCTNFEAIKNIAQKTAACFPDCLYMGIDILITANLKKIMVLEVNAFGDLLPNLTDNGETIYQAQINASAQKYT